MRLLAARAALAALIMSHAQRAGGHGSTRRCAGAGTAGRASAYAAGLHEPDPDSDAGPGLYRAAGGGEDQTPLHREPGWREAISQSDWATSGSHLMSIAVEGRDYLVRAFGGVGIDRGPEAEGRSERAAWAGGSGGALRLPCSLSLSLRRGSAFRLVYLGV